MAQTHTSRLSRRPHEPHRASPTGKAFTLIELLVVVAILTILMAIVSASLLKVRTAAKSFVCKNKLRNVAFDFIRFADDYAHPWRGDSDVDGQPGFRLVDFQERTYGIAEFWKMEAVPMSGIGPGTFLSDQYDASSHPLICPAGPQELHRRPMAPLTRKPVFPVENVSIAMNKRLHRCTGTQNGEFYFKDVRISKRIVEYPMIPLAFDADGQKAYENDLQSSAGILPYFAAPPLEKADAYSDGIFWFPSFRHGGKLNAAFVGGHVLSSADPLHAPGWNWGEPPTAR